MHKIEKICNKMAFIELKKGDINNLEGKVLAYAKIMDTPEEFSDTVIALYSTTNPVDFKERFSDIPLEDLDDLEKIVGETRVNENNEKKDFNDFGDEHKKVYSLFCAIFPTTLEEMKIAQEDVLDLGEFDCPAQFKFAAMGAVQLYIANYDRQRRQKAGMSDNQKNEENKGYEEKENLATYSSIDTDMTKYLQLNYIAPIMFEIETDNMTGAKKRAEDFLRFCDESPLLDDAYSMVAVLNSNKSQKRTNLLYAYFNKILAIVSERYIDAAKIRDEIKEMKNK
jgi:hypothetical protein